jgi:hypothetical protein
MGYMLTGQYSKKKFMEKRKQNQIAYANRFHEFAGVERLSYMLRMEKN